MLHEPVQALGELVFCGQGRSACAEDGTCPQWDVCFLTELLYTAPQQGIGSKHPRREEQVGNERRPEATDK